MFEGKVVVYITFLLVMILVIGGVFYYGIHWAYDQQGVVHG